MTDDRKSGDLSDLDWDSALDEWEKNTFVPEGASDVQSRAGDALAVTATPEGVAPTTSPPDPALPPDSIASDPRIPAAGAAQGSLKNVSSEGTVIAPVPRELRGAAPPPRPSSPSLSPPSLSPIPPPTRASAPSLSAPIPPMRSSSPSMPFVPGPPRPGAPRGGLSQLFSKGKDARSLAPPPTPGVGSERTRVAIPSAPDLAASKEPEGAEDRTRENVGSAPELAALAALGRPQEPFSGREAYVDAEGAPTLVGRSLEDAEARAAAIAAAAPLPPSPEPDEQVPETRQRPSISVDLKAAPIAPPSAVEGMDEPSPAPAAAGPTEDSVSVEIPRDDSVSVPLPGRTFDSETVVAGRRLQPSISDAETQTRHPADRRSLSRSPADDEAPTFMRPSPSGMPPAEPEAPTSDAPVLASRWLDAAHARVFHQRAAWLEEEARAIGDPTEQARALLAVSELRAIAGDAEGALAAAGEARALAPGLPLAWRQTRQVVPLDPQLLAEALDAEAARAPTAPARAHSTLLAADVLRTNGDGDAAVRRWNSACKLDPADVRAPAARAALALAQHDLTGAGGDLAENSELVTLDRAVGVALRMRGHPRPGTEVDLAMPINDGLRKARQALLAQDVVGAAQGAVEIGQGADGTLAKASQWLSAALGATHVAGRRVASRALKTLVAEGDAAACRPLAARGIELVDPELIAAALVDDAPFQPAERVALQALAGQSPSASILDELEPRTDLAPLVDALTAVDGAGSADALARRARRTSGNRQHRASVTLGRLLAGRAATDAVDAALADVGSPRSAALDGAGLDVAWRAERWGEVGEALGVLSSPDDRSGDAVVVPAAPIASALFAERAGRGQEARLGWRSATDEGAQHDSIVRAAAGFVGASPLSAARPSEEGGLPSRSDGAARAFGPALLEIADDMPDGPTAAVLRLEALSRGDLDDAEQAAILERVHRGAPGLGIGAVLAERIGRKNGDVDEVLRWIQERRTYATDPLEAALDAVREALLVADRDAELASTRLEEAHRSRPDDVALRELYERLATEAPTDRGAWREQRAAKVSGPTRVLLLTEAAIEHERAGDPAAARAAARAAREAGDAGLSGLLGERADVATGATTDLTASLLDAARAADDDVTRRAMYERLAELDAIGRKNPAAALLWHKTILELTPDHKPSLRYVEHVLVGDGRDDELATVFEQIALALDGTGGGEVAGHAQLAARLQTRAEGGWEKTSPLARLAATQPEPSLWSLRALNAHARTQKDDEAILKTTLTLLERTQRPLERAALLLRASEAGARLEQVADARAYLEQAAAEDPGDVVTWGFLAEVRERSGEARAAAEACESLARTSSVGEHQLLAWFDAARIWLDEVKDSERGMGALEACAEIDVTHADVFQRLSALYASARLDAELARLLEKRLAIVEDEGERVGLQVELSRALAEMGELAKAKAALESALAQRPDHTTALAAMAELCAKEGDWPGAEQAYVRLARLLTAPEEQREIYEKLGAIYGIHTTNLSRAEVAYKEVLKRAPGDLPTLGKLVDIYKRQGDLARAAETQQQMISETSDPAERLQRLVELSAIHETVGRDARRAEQVLESARKEYPTSVVALRAMAEFYLRQRQMPAMQILLDRAAGDARRSFAAGRFVTSLFEVLHAAYELRGRKDAARVVAATLAAVEGQPSELIGADARAIDPRLDDILVPEVVNPALRAMLHRVGDSLDMAAAVDLRALRATPLVPGTPLGTTVGAVATVVGLGALQILVSPQLGRVALPLGSNPPVLLVGEGLMKVEGERARTFVVVRALKMILARGSSLARGEAAEVGALVSAMFTAFNPSFVPQNVDARRVADLQRRLVPALPRNLDPTIGVIALEAAGTLGPHTGLLANGVAAWANRVALLAVGDPSAALDAIAWARGEEAAPKNPEKRAAWIARTTEARELMTFSVTDTYAEARTRLGLGG